MENELIDTSDYRDFLATRFAQNKKLNKATSFQNFALASKRSRAYLKNVLSKKRHLSLDSIEDVAKYLKLSKAEKEFVLYQFLASQTETPEVQEHFQKAVSILKEQIRDEHKVGGKIHGISPENKSYLFAYLKDLIVATLAHNPEFRLDALWVSKQLTGVAKISPHEAEIILDRLLKAGVLKKMPSGKIEVVEDQVHTIHPAEFNYFRSALGMVIDSFDQIIEHRPSRFEMGALSFSDETYEKVLAELKEFVQRIGEYSKGETAKERRVFLTNFSLLCVAQPRQS